jgi:uncharacterized protein YdaL
MAEKDGPRRSFTWTRSYFDEVETTMSWGPFKEREFIHFHRPLSTYWKEFKNAGLEVLDFEEPRFFSKAHNYDISCSAIFHLKRKA